MRMIKIRNFLVLCFMFLLLSVNVIGQEYDLLIKGGRLIDPKNDIDQKMDVAVKDGIIANVARNIAESSATTVVDANGLIVTPGIIDINVHIFAGTKPDAAYSNGFNSVTPDGFTFRAGVTTVVDAGSAGWRNFRFFKEQTIDHSKTRVLAFLNSVGSGMKGGAIEQNLADMDAKLTAMTARKYREHIVGIKLAHYSGPEWDPVNNMVKAGELIEMPAMIDFGGHMPQMSLETLLMEKLRPGDIYTHCYAQLRSRTPIVDENGKVRPYVWDAQKRGVVFDVGHGGGSFMYDQAIPAMEQDFKPNSISTDLHIGSMNGGMKDMLNVMSKFLNMGLTLEEVIEVSTWAPARYILREELGHLSMGSEADIAVFSLEKGDFGFIDTRGWKIKGDQKLVCELTIRAGDVVWDLNGLASKEWIKQ